MRHRSVTPGFWALVAVTFLMLGLAACQPTTPATPTQVPPAATAIPASPAVEAGADQTTPVPVLPAQEDPTVEPETEKAIAAARAALAQRLDVHEDEVLVKSVEAADWPDASLGCPQPGMMYAQMITPGYRVVLEVEGQPYEVHTDRGQTAVLCDEEVSTMEVPPVPGTIEPGLERLIDQAKEDLAQRLSIMVDEIEVLEAKAVVWPDASLGCPQPGMRYRQVPMDGALIQLQAEGKVYEYHSGGGRDPFLCEQPLELQKDAPPQIDLLKLTPPSPSD